MRQSLKKFGQTLVGQDWLRVWVRLLLLVVLIFWLTKIIFVDYSLILSPIQDESRETADLTTISLIVRGQNPYVLANLPRYNNVYGVGYYALTASLVKFFGHYLLIARLLIGLFFLAAMIFFYWLMKRLNIDWLYALAGTVLLASCIIHSGDLASRPDAMGFFLYLLTVFIPWLDKFSWRSLIISLFLGLLAFYTKAYFVFGAFYVGVYAWLFISKKKGLVYCASFLVLLSISALIMNNLFPFYFINTFFALGSGLSYNQHHMIRQLVMLIAANPGLTILFAAAIGLVFSHWYRTKQTGKVDLQHWQEPIFSGSLDYIVFCLVVSTLVFVAYLGGNGGRFLGYFYQLATLFLIIFTFKTLKLKSLWLEILVIILIIGNLFVIGRHWSDNFAKLTDVELANWQKVETLIKQHKTIMASSSVSYLLFMNNKLIYDNGQTEYFHWGGLSSAAERYFQNYNLIIPADNAYRNDIKNKIINKEFDLILAQDGVLGADQDLLDKYYDKQSSYTLRMYGDSTDWSINAYEPKSKQK